MTKTSTALAVLIIGLLVPPGRARAETVQATVEGGELAVQVQFQPERLYAGNGSADLEVLVSAVSQDKLRLLKRATSDDGFMSVHKQVAGSQSVSSGVARQSYLLTIELHSNVDPRTHEMVFEFVPPSGSESLRAYAELPIGVVNNGQLAAKIEEEAIDVGLVRGERQFNVLLNNTFPEYDAYINKLELSATPEYLVGLSSVRGAKVADGTATFDPPLVVRALSPASLPIVLRVNSPDMSGAVRGIKNPALTLRLTYNDGKGRQISDLKIQKSVKAPVAVGYALLAVILGLALGVGLAGGFGEGHSPKATAANLLAAILIIVFVVSGHLKLSIFDASWDYGCAVTLLLLSAVAVLAGAPYLKKWLKLAPNPPGGNAGAPGVAVLALAAGLSLVGAATEARAQEVSHKETAGNGKAVKAKAKSAQKAAGALDAEGLVQRGAFYLNAGNLDQAEKSLSGATGSETPADAERARYLLGTLQQRKYYALKEQQGQRKWSLLYLAEQAYREARQKSGGTSHSTYAADSAFNLVLIQIERGTLAQARTALADLEQSAQKDATVHVYQVVWSSVPSTVIDADFPTTFLAGVLRKEIEGGQPLGPACFTDIINALKDQKAGTAPAAATSPPLVSVAVPHAVAKQVGEKGGTALYDFALSLSVPKERRGEIKEVDYKLDHPTFSKKIYASSDGSRDFSVGYTGWGALSRVDVKIVRTDGKEETMTFDMLADLGWQ